MLPGAVSMAEAFGNPPSKEGFLEPVIHYEHTLQA